MLPLDGGASLARWGGGRGVSFVESDEQRMLREAVRSLARRFGHRYYLEVSRSDRKADELWLELARYGYLGVNIPEEYGGAGAGVTELAMVCEELAAAGTPSFMLIVSSAICGELLVVRTAARRRSSNGCLASLPARPRWPSRSPSPTPAPTPTGIATTATRDGDAYRLRGAKVFASAVDEADRVVVVARTGADAVHGPRAAVAVPGRSSLAPASSAS